MRPIDADALPEHKFVGNKFTQIGGRRNGKLLEAVNQVYQQGWNDAIDAIVDNEPTVEQECYITGAQWNEFMKEHKRPQGEWLHPYVTDIACECSICHVQMPTHRFNFCPNCGAEMRKEEEE